MEVALSFLVLFLLLGIIIVLYWLFNKVWIKLVYRPVKKINGSYTFNKHIVAEYASLLGAILLIVTMSYLIYLEWDAIYHSSDFYTRLFSMIILAMLVIRVLIIALEAFDQYSNRDDQLIITDQKLIIHDNEHHIEYELNKMNSLVKNRRFSKEGRISFKYDGYDTFIDLYELNLSGYRKQIYKLLIKYSAS